MMGTINTGFMETIMNRKREVEALLFHLKQNQEEYNALLAEDGGSDESDQAQKEIVASNNYRLIERKTRELKQIETIIKRLTKDEQVGECEECGDPIPLPRLLAVPETTLCVACQRELEKFTRMRPPVPGKRRGPGGPHEWAPSGWREEENMDELEYDLMASGISADLEGHQDDQPVSLT